MRRKIRLKGKQKKLNIFSYVARRKKVVVFTLLLLLVAVLLGRAVTYLNSYLVDNAIVPQNFSLFLGLGFAILGLLIIEAFCLWGQNRVFSDMGYEIEREIRLDVLKKLLFAPYSYYEKNDLSQSLSRITFVDDFGNFVSDNLVPFMINVLKFVTVFVFVLAINPVMGAMILGVFALILIVVFITSKISSKRNKTYKQSEIDRAKITMDSVFGLETIVDAGETDKFQNDFNKVLDQTTKKWMKFSIHNELFLPLVEGIWFLGIIIVYVFAFFKMGSVGFEVGAIISFIHYITQANEPIKQSALNYQQFVNINGALNKVFDIFDIDNSHLDKRTEIIQNPCPEIEINNLTFRHPYKNTHIKNFSHNIKFGEKIAFVGESGSGKTTLCYLLSRIYAPDSGEILVGGVDISKIQKGDFENNVSLLSSTPNLFETTLKNNILMGVNATDEEIWDVLKIVGLYGKVKGFKHGLNEKIRKGGNIFSQSEKQLLEIVSILIKKPKIVLFDSSFGAMSTRQRNKVFKIIKENFAEITCVFFCDPDSELPFECDKFEI